jgi:copper oxidase (laccase) domain-containing protein
MYKLKYALSQVKDGNMDHRFGTIKESSRNKRMFLLKNDFLPEDTVCMAVQMEDEFMYVDEKEKGSGVDDRESALEYDALITKTPNLNLFLTVADCLPIILFDERIGILALAHLSWSNTDKEYIKKILKEFKKMKSNPKNIQVIIGPGVQRNSLIYDRNIFKKTENNWGIHIKRVGEEKYSVDNLGFTIEQILKEGILKEKVKVHNVDTVKDERYFSHIRDLRNGKQDQGRFAMVVTFSK